MAQVISYSARDNLRAMPVRMDSVRKLLVGLIEDRKLTLSDVSRELGKNHAYLQQFIKRGIPQKLPEDIRGRLAEMFSVDEVLLGAPMKPGAKPKTGAPTEPTPSLPEFDLRGGVAYGGGADGTGEWNEEGNASQMAVAQWGLPPSFVKQELGLSFDMADVLPVKGDSMDDGTKHGLSSGDRVIVDRQDRDPRQGGIYAVWDGGGVIVKQVELIRDSDPPRVICKSLNTRYQPIELILDGNAHIIGRAAGKIARM